MGNVLSDYRSRRAPQPRQKPENALQQMLAVIAQQRGAQGGPTTQDMQQQQLRSLMQRQDPSKFQSLQRRGFDPLQGGAEYALPPTQAELLPDSMNPALQMPGYTVRSGVPQKYETNLSPVQLALVERSMATQRGQAQAARRALDDSILEMQLRKIEESPVPGNYWDGSDPGDNSYKRRLMQMFVHATGQGGGMRP